jgi:chloride channel protein, CIC family
VALVVGVLGAVILAAARVLATRTDGLRGRLGLPALLIAGGLAVGVLAELADLLGADSQDVLFSGQASCPTSSRRTRRR